MSSVNLTRVWKSVASLLILSGLALLPFAVPTSAPANAQSVSLRLLASSGTTNKILMYDRRTGEFEGTFASLSDAITCPAPQCEPQDLTYGPDGNLYVPSHWSHEILRFDGRTGAFIDVFVSSGSGGLFFPICLLFGREGNLFVSNSGTGEILRYDGRTGAFIDAFVPAGSGLDIPIYMAFGPRGDLFVANLFGPDGDGAILRYDGRTGASLGVFADSPELFLPTGVIFGPDGNLYVGSLGDLTNYDSAILRYDGKTGAFLGVFADSPELIVADDMVFGPDHNLYVSSNIYGAVLRFDGRTGAPLPAPGQTGAVFVPPGSGGLDFTRGVTFALVRN